MVSDGTDEELNKCELYFPQVLQQEVAILYFILKLLVIRRAACRLYLQISLINVPTYTSHCFVYLYLKELFDCKPQKSNLLNIKETMYWPRYLIYSTSIGRAEESYKVLKLDFGSVFTLYLCSDTLCRRFYSLTLALVYERTHVLGPLCTDIHVQLMIKEKNTFFYLCLKVSKELACKVSLGHKPCPGATVLVCYTRQVGQDIRGHRLTLVTRRAAFRVHYTNRRGGR